MSGNDGQTVLTSEWCCRSGCSRKAQPALLISEETDYLRRIGEASVPRCPLRTSSLHPGAPLSIRCGSAIGRLCRIGSSSQSSYPVSEAPGTNPSCRELFLGIGQRRHY